MTYLLNALIIGYNLRVGNVHVASYVICIRLIVGNNLRVSDVHVASYVICIRLKVAFNQKLLVPEVLEVLEGHSTHHRYGVETHVWVFLKYKNKTNHTISSNSHTSATANKEMLFTQPQMRRWLQNQRELHKILTNYGAMYLMTVAENSSSSGMLMT